MFLFWILLPMKVSASVYVIHNIDESSVRVLTFQLSKLLSPVTQPQPIRSQYFQRNEPNFNHDDVIVTIGVDSFKEVCASISKGIVIASFIGEEEYLNIQSECDVPTSAVFSGAPLDKRLTLLAAVWPDRKPLALLYSDNVTVDETKFSSIADEYGFEFQFLKTKTDRLSVLRSVNYVLEESELIFALVDTKLYENGIVQDVLKLLHHKRKLMTGPYATIVRAGALFAIDTDSSEKLNALVNRIDTWRFTGYLLEASYPDSFRVIFNPYLIRAHNIVLPSASYLRDEYGLCSENAC